MKNISELLKDKKYVSELLNGQCRPIAKNRVCAPINLDWIDETMSQAATEASRRLLADGIPYVPYIIAERNPDTVCDGTAVDNNEKRMRYFVIMVIPDTEYPYNYSAPLINELWKISLNCWETIRAAAAAAVEYQYVQIANDPIPPILNNAVIEWVTLYLGRKPYRGITLLSEQWENIADFDGCESSINLYKVREMEQNDIIQRLIDAYNVDFPEINCKNASEVTSDKPEVT